MSSEVPSEAERIAAISSLYQADRQDGATIATTALALVALALTYLGIGAVLLNNDDVPGGAWVSAFLAFPLYIVTSYHALLVGASFVRTASVEILEAELFSLTGMSDEVRAKVGSRAGQPVMNVAEQPPVLRIETYVSYGGVVLVIVAFTVYCLIIAAEDDGWISGPVITAAVIYALLSIAALRAWLYVLSLAVGIEKAAEASAPSRSTSE